MAGTFYPSSEHACRERAMRYVAVQAPASDAANPRWLGAVVPHAGWICSGAIAGLSVGTLARAWRERPPNVVVIFGAIHSPWPADEAKLASATVWQTPLGESAVAWALQERLASAGTSLFEIDDRFHEHEHAVEVELPLVQAAWPEAAILPVEVPPNVRATLIGSAVAETARELGLSCVYLASSDLTHYGPAYHFAPAGVGLDALEWAKQNDRLLLDRVTALAANDVVPHALEHHNACGPGAIAAMLSACLSHGASDGRLLMHANSYETLRNVHPQQPTDAVGYAAVVVG
jgi:AmmeMemoRadiSam system protein B